MSLWSASFWNTSSLFVFNKTRWWREFWYSWCISNGELYLILKTRGEDGVTHWACRPVSLVNIPQFFFFFFWQPTHFWKKYHKSNVVYYNESLDRVCSQACSPGGGSRPQKNWNQCSQSLGLSSPESQPAGVFTFPSSVTDERLTPGGHIPRSFRFYKSQEQLKT